MSSKKICFLIESIQGGGAQRVILTLADAFVQKGYEIDIISIYNIIEFPVMNNDINILYLSKHKRINKILLPIVILLSIIKLKKFLKNNHYKFIISHSLYTTICSRFIKNTHFYHCIHNRVFFPRILKLHSYSNTRLNNNFISQVIYNNLDLITVSNGLQEVIQSIGIHPKSIITMHNPFNIEYIQKQSEEYVVNKDNYIIAIGRLHYQKRYDILIEAYKQSGIQQNLLILGEGILQQAIKKLITDQGLEERVILKGFIQNPYPYIKKAKALVLSSDFEGLPLVLIESMILRTPVISTDCPTGPNEILTDDLAPFLSPVGDVEALALNIQKVIAEPPRIEDKYFMHFDMNQIAEKYLSYCLSKNNRIRSKSSRKICFLVYSLYGGGAERVVLTLAKALASKGYVIDIVLLYNEIYYSIPNGNINIIILNKRKSISNFFLPLFIIQSVFSLKKFFRNNNYECIISHSVYTSICSRFIRKKPIYHCIHNSDLIPRMSIRHYANYKSNIISQLMYNNQKLITVSRGIIENNADSIFPRSIQTIYNPLDIEQIRIKAEEYNVAESNYIIAIGRLHFQKRYDLLIQAYKQSGIQQKLLIFGEGILQKSLQKFIAYQGLENRVILKGFIQNPYPYIKKAKSLVLSSDFEGFGIVLAEALILGTPVVSTDCPSGPNEILIDELSEFLSPIGNTEALARNIQKVIKNPPIITSKYYTKFDMNYIAEKYLNYCLEND